jgi:hypothetical protein
VLEAHVLKGIPFGPWAVGPKCFLLCQKRPLQLGVDQMTASSELGSAKEMGANREEVGGFQAAASHEIPRQRLDYGRGPLGCVEFVFPWNEPNTELFGRRGPEPWQRRVLEQMSGLSPEAAMQIATASGHGVGKSALVAWTIIWAISTFPDTRGVVTANTEVQLKTKTWSELAKWYRLFIGRDLFRYEATCLFAKAPGHEKTWRVDMVPWSEKNAEAFAGLHNQGRRILLVFDEASAIPPIIWETAQGALTDKDTEILWCVFGNPTRPDGEFRACFPGGRMAHRWLHHKVDSRAVSFTNKRFIEDLISDYGADSDRVRVRVLGEFPRHSVEQFFDSEAIDAAMAREDIVAQRHDPLIVGVDVARYGNDESVIFIRQGRDARTHPPRRYAGIDTMQLAANIINVCSELHPDAVFIDGGGVGGGVVDRCRQLGLSVFEVDFGARPDRAAPEKCANKRSEMYVLAREWLAGGALPDDPDLRDQLMSIEYSYREPGQELLLTSKRDMRRAGVPSPDLVDGLIVTFAWPVMPREVVPPGTSVEHEYDPFAEAA